MIKCNISLSCKNIFITEKIIICFQVFFIGLFDGRSLIKFFYISSVTFCEKANKMAWKTPPNVPRKNFPTNFTPSTSNAVERDRREEFKFAASIYLARNWPSALCNFALFFVTWVWRCKKKDETWPQSQELNIMANICNLMIILTMLHCVYSKR